MSWHLGMLCALDFESTGLSVDDDRIVTACVALVDGSGQHRPDVRTWLINPGIDIPAGATKIHGITTEHAREHGQDPGTAIAEIVTDLADALDAGIPIVGHNVGGYDLSLLDRETRRHAVAPLTPFPVIDTQVLSKHVDPFRKKVSATQGPHTLKTCAQVFRAGWDDEQAHGAAYDALASARVAWRMGVIANLPKEQRPKLASKASRELFDALAVPLADLHAFQVKAKAAQDAGFADYLGRQSKAARTVEEQLALYERSEAVRAEAVVGHWPVVPYQHSEAMA